MMCVWQNICALKRIASWLCFFVSPRSFFFSFCKKKKKSPTELGSKTMVYLNIQKLLVAFLFRKKTRRFPILDPSWKKKVPLDHVDGGLKLFFWKDGFPSFIFEKNFHLPSLKKTSIFEKKMVFWKKDGFHKNMERSGKPCFRKKQHFSPAHLQFLTSR